jgi:gliding motility-associated-like protein
LVNDNADAEFNWQPPNAADLTWTNEPFELLTSTAGIWSVTTSNPGNGCASTTEVNISEDFTFPEVEAGYADTLTCSAPTSLISGIAVSPVDYTPILNWDWVEGALNALDPLAPTALAPGTYFLTVAFEENGCVSQDSVIVYQDPEATIDASSARFPNVISPNRDGYNDRLTLYLEEFPDFPLLSIVQEFELSIFNRWGNLVYSYQGGPVEWDGRINDDDVAEGFYYYKLEYLVVCGDEQRGTLTGGFELFR